MQWCANKLTQILKAMNAKKNYTHGRSVGKKNPPAIQETQIWSLGWEDTLEKEMATPSSILAWEIPGTEEPGRLHSMGSQKSNMT